MSFDSMITNVYGYCEEARNKRTYDACLSHIEYAEVALAAAVNYSVTVSDYLEIRAARQEIERTRALLPVVGTPVLHAELCKLEKEWSRLALTWEMNDQLTPEQHDRLCDLEEILDLYDFPYSF